MDEVRKSIQPIKKKWVYHFIVSPKTSVIEKPEWYLNQTLKWIYEHIDAVDSKVKLSPNDKTSCDCTVKQMFILCMVELAMMRLKKDIKTISIPTANSPSDERHNTAILIHTYNEVMRFTKVVKQLLGDAFSKKVDDEHDLLSALCNQKLFDKIVDIEWECAEKNLKEITSDPNRWDLILDGQFEDEYKIPRCVDRLMLLNRSVYDRVDCFREIDCKFNLIELQCSLFAKFLIFLKRSIESSPTSFNILSDLLMVSDQSTIDLTRILRVMNGVDFLRLVLKDKYFIPDNVIEELDLNLVEKANKIALDYKDFFYRLVERVLAIYECVDSDLRQFLEFIRPKLSHHIFEVIREEALKQQEGRQTKSLLVNLGLSGK